MPRARILAATLTLCAVGSGIAQAQPSATMSAAFTPERLGAPTTISASFNLTWSEPRAPVLTGVTLVYPHNLGFATSGLGLAPCDPALLEENGPNICPANSRMGGGSALVEVPIGGLLYKESVQLTLLAGPSPQGNLQMLVSGVGSTPVVASVVLNAELLAGRLSITVPPIPTLPEGPYVALVAMHLTLGGHLTYYELVHGKSVAYHPAGIGLPPSCPRGGFRFGATFAFLDGRHASAHTRVPCPHKRSR
jgi:hypothetical protein